MTPTLPITPPPAPDGLPGRDAATRMAAVLVVLLLVLLQALGPFLHAHARSAHGGAGLHLHLVGAGQPALAIDRSPSPLATLPMAAPDEGSAVFLTTEYRRDAELAPVLLASAGLPARVPAVRADAGDGQDGLRWPAATALAPPATPADRLPPATAPPQA